LSRGEILDLLHLRENKDKKALHISIREGVVLRGKVLVKALILEVDSQNWMTDLG
jgi:hypothetical protein